MLGSKSCTIPVMGLALGVLTVVVVAAVAYKCAAASRKLAESNRKRMELDRKNEVHHYLCRRHTKDSIIKMQDTNPKKWVPWQEKWQKIEWKLKRPMQSGLQSGPYSESNCDLLSG